MTTARQILYLEPVLIVCQGQQAHLHGVLDFETAVTCLACCGILREIKLIQHKLFSESKVKSNFRCLFETISSFQPVGRV